MTTPTNDRQTSERERLVLPMTASMVPHPMYASGWNACLDAHKEALDFFQSEIAALRAENEALRTDAKRYRWLREANDDGDDGSPCMQVAEVYSDFTNYPTGDKFDEAVDTFMHIHSKESRRG